MEAVDHSGQGEIQGPQAQDREHVGGIDDERVLIFLQSPFVDKVSPQDPVVAVFVIGKSGSTKRRLVPPGGRGESLAGKCEWFGHGWRPIAWEGGRKTFMEPPEVGRRSIKKDLQHGCHAEGLAHRFHPTTRPSAGAPVMLTLSRGATPLQKNINTDCPPESSIRIFQACCRYEVVDRDEAGRRPVVHAARPHAGQRIGSSQTETAMATRVKGAPIFT
jgi:hypothetical protein